MVVKISDGVAFGGLVRYMTHDAPGPERGSKPPTTTERVAWSRCENLPADDPELAIRIMAATVRDADHLKAAAGVSARGRKLQKPVKHIVISWPAGDEPSETEQLEATSALLTDLGLEDRQRVTVAHDDRDHRHVHICVNRVSDVDGRAAPSNNERRTASTWAEKFELERERRPRIECPARVENRQCREEREGSTIHTTPKRRRRDTGEPVDPLPGETMLWGVHRETWKHIPADDPAARRTRRELARDLEAVRDDAGPAPGATLERRRPPLYSRAEIEIEMEAREPQPAEMLAEMLTEMEARRRERAARQPEAAQATRDQAAAPPPPRPTAEDLLAAFDLEDEVAAQKRQRRRPPHPPPAASPAPQTNEPPPSERARDDAVAEAVTAPRRADPDPAPAPDIYRDPVHTAGGEDAQEAGGADTLPRVHDEPEPSVAPPPAAETPEAPASGGFFRTLLGRQRPSAAETPPEAPVAAETPEAPASGGFFRTLLGRQHPSAAETPPEAPVAAETPPEAPVAAETPPEAPVAAETPEAPPDPPDPYGNPVLGMRGEDKREAGGAERSQVHDRKHPKRDGRTGGGR